MIPSSACPSRQTDRSGPNRTSSLPTTSYTTPWGTINNRGERQDQFQWRPASKSMARRRHQRENLRFGSAPTAGSWWSLQVAPISLVSDCGGDTVSIGDDANAGTDLHVAIVELLARPAPTTPVSNTTPNSAAGCSSLGLACAVLMHPPRSILLPDVAFGGGQ